MYEVILPKIEPNTEEAFISQWLKKEGQEVKKGEPLFLMETTKAVIEVEAEAAGVLRKIVVPEKQTIPVLTVIGFIGGANEPIPDIHAAPKPAVPAPAPVVAPFVPGTAGSITQDRKPATQNPPPLTLQLLPSTSDRILASPAAKRLARERGVDLAQIKGSGEGGRIGEEDVQKFLASPSPSGKNRVLVIGASMGAEVVASFLLEDPSVEIVGYVDDNAQKHGQSIFGKPVLGPTSLVEQLRAEKKFDSLIVSITSNIRVRRMLFERYKQMGCRFVNAVHRTAYISPSAQVGEGNIICAFVHIGFNARVGDNNLLSAHTDIEHHNVLGSHNSFGPHCSTSGDVQIGDSCLFGTGIFIQPHIQIGSHAKIASGSIIISHVKEGESVKMEVNSPHSKLGGIPIERS